MPDPNELPSIVVPPSPPVRARRFGLRFSLLTLCGLVLVACFAAAYWGVTRREAAAVQRAALLAERVETQQREIERLKAELGYLTINDPAKIHVLQLPTRDNYHWKWRIYLPEGRWKVFQGAGGVRPQGFDNVAHSMSSLEAGEFTLEALVDRSPDGSPRFLWIRDNGKSTIGISEENYERLKSGAGWSTLGGIGRTELRAVNDAPLELLRVRSHKVLSEEPGSRTTGTTDEPTFGLLLWIERARPGE
jgi:hypothetical protein